MSWPEKAGLAATVQQMLKTVPVGMFALARDGADEICIFDGRGVRYTIQPPRHEHGSKHYAVIEWGQAEDEPHGFGRNFAKQEKRNENLRV